MRRCVLCTAVFEQMQFFRSLVMMSIGTAIAFSEIDIAVAQVVVKPAPNNSVSSQEQKNLAPFNLAPANDPLYLPTRIDDIKLEKIQPISLAQALEIARQNHTELRIAELTLQRSQAALRQAQAANSPTITVVGELESDRSAKETLLDLRKDGEVRRSLTSLGGTLEASYDIFTSGKREALVQAAEEKLRVDRLDVQRLSAQIRLDVTNAYYDLQEADEQIRIARSAVELQQQLAQRQISDQQRLASLADNRPQISLFANYQLVYGLDSSLGVVDGYSIGARMRWNLLDGGVAQAAADREEIDKAIAETRFTDTRNQTRLQVEKAYKNLQASAKNIETSELALKQARESFELARLRFQTDVGTQLDVSTAQSDLTRADGNRVRAILNYNRALASLQRAVAQ